MDDAQPGPEPDFKALQDLIDMEHDRLVNSTAFNKRTVRDVITVLDNARAALKCLSARPSSGQEWNEAIEAAMQVIRRRLDKENECEALGFSDPETGARECSMENNSDICICAERLEEVEAIYKIIKGLKRPAAQPEGDRK